MFDLEKAIASWRHNFRYRRVFFDEDLEELERHLRDHISRLTKEEWSDEAAFRESVRMVGAYSDTEAEYRKVFWAKLKHKRRLIQNLVWEITMLKNYAKIAIRSLLKHKGYSFINVFGLAVGIGCCLLIMLYVQDELAYDQLHEHSSQIHRVLIEPSREAAQPSALNMFFVADRIKEGYPEVQAATNFFRHWESPLIAHGQEGAIEKQVFFTNSDFFEVFSFNLLQGNPQTVLDAPFSVVLTESSAEKYFGSEDPIGKTIRYNSQYELEVTGIMEDVPRRSHFHPEFLVSMPTLPKVSYGGIQVEWRVFYTYVVLRDGINGAQMERKAADFYHQHYGSESPARLLLQPLMDIHLRSQVSNELESNSDIQYLYLLSGIGVLLLLIACINYMNLATARSMNRAREVGMRKMVGAFRIQIIRQFFGESLFLSLLALILAVGLVVILLPLIHSTTGRDLALATNNEWIWGGGVVLVLLVGLIAGIYPAIFLSRFQPAHILKGQFKSGGQGRRLRKGLVVVQFAMSIILVIGTLGVFEQLSFLQNARLGFEKDQIVVIPVQDGAMREQYAALRDELMRLSDVVTVGATSSAYPGRAHSYHHAISREGASSDDAITTYRNWVDAGYLEALELELAAGRYFSSNIQADQESILLNEAAVRELGWESAATAVGEQVLLDDRTWTVVGVVEDFHFQSLHHHIESLIFTPSFFPTNLLVRVQSTEMASTISSLKAAWGAFTDDQPFTYSFLDDTIDAQYQADAQWGQVISYAAVLSIVIACLGLFGLAAFSAEQRTKEIGIRKALGASISGMVLLLSRDFLKLVLLAFLLSAPIAYYAMNQWLDGYAYRMEISVWLFVMAAGISVSIALLTVCYQAGKAALINPVKALRYE